MKKPILLCGVFTLFVMCQVVCAMPPLPEMEETMAKADVIAIVKTTEIKTAEGMYHFNRVVGINIIKVLKTDVKAPGSDTGQDMQGNVFFSQPDAPQGEGGKHCENRSGWRWQSQARVGRASARVSQTIAGQERVFSGMRPLWLHSAERTIGRGIAPSQPADHVTHRMEREDCGRTASEGYAELLPPGDGFCR